MTKAEVFLPLSQGKVTVIDFDDFEKVRGMKWSVNEEGRNFYARHSARVGDKWAKVALHRFLTDCPPDLQVNHINGDGLNNRRENLQICTRKQNLSAFCRKRDGVTSKYRGVSRDNSRKRWFAQIKHIHLGRFDSEEDAARAYDKKVTELFGEYASLNFPKSNNSQNNTNE